MYSPPPCVSGLHPSTVQSFRRPSDAPTNDAHPTPRRNEPDPSPSTARPSTPKTRNHAPTTSTTTRSGRASPHTKPQLTHRNHPTLKRPCSTPANPTGTYSPPSHPVEIRRASKVCAGVPTGRAPRTFPTIDRSQARTGSPITRGLLSVKGRVRGGQLRTSVGV